MGLTPDPSNPSDLDRMDARRIAPAKRAHYGVFFPAPGLQGDRVVPLGPGSGGRSGIASTASSNFSAIFKDCSKLLSLYSCSKIFRPADDSLFNRDAGVAFGGDETLGAEGLGAEAGFGVLAPAIVATTSAPFTMPLPNFLYRSSSL